MRLCDTRRCGWLALRGSCILPVFPGMEARVVSSRGARVSSRATAWGFLLLCALLQAACAPRQGQPEKPDEAAVEGVAPIVAQAERAMQRGDFTAAIAGYKLAFERTPWNTRLARSLVAAYAARAAKPAGSGRTGLRAAEADLRAALRIAPDDPALRRSLTAVLLDLSAREEDPDRAAALREEARRFDPDLETQTPIVQLAVERRLDMAFDLLERGQLDAGIDRLERLYADYPDSVDVMRLLAQAHIRKGTELAALRNYRDAGIHFDRAVGLYDRLAPCDGARCEESELRMAHRNRVVAWLSAFQFVESQQALEAAEAAGLSFPALRAELRRLGERAQ